MNEAISYERYDRQIILKEFGEAAQRKLLNAKILVVGAGGLGCPLLLYLAAAGVGTIGVVDFDTIVLSNLQRQVLYSVSDIGQFKATTATRRLKELNPELNIIAFDLPLNSQNALPLIAAFDIVVDATDNFPARYLINDACVLLNKPLVYGAIDRYEGQVAVFNYVKHPGDISANYRDLFPDPVRNDEVLNCEQGGVLGVLPGIVGTMMANETMKIITGIGEPLANQLLTYNILSNQTYQAEFFPRAETSSFIPQTRQAFAATNYEWMCSSQSVSLEIDIKTFDDLLNSRAIAVIDVREPNEKPDVGEFSCERIPLSQLATASLPVEGNTIVFICQTGTRSLEAARRFSESSINRPANVYSLKGGIVAWKRNREKQLA